MNVEDCIVAVERRSLGGCLDLAFVFTREFAGPILRLTLCFAIPSCATVWLLTSSATDMLIPSILILALSVTLYGGALVAAVGPQVFGVPISTRRALRSVWHRAAGFLFLSAVYRFLQLMTAFLLVLPSVIVTSRLGHLPEVLLLEQTSVSGTLPRLSWLTAGGGHTRNFVRLLALLGFWALFSTGLLILADLLSTALFNVPVFLARLPQTDVDFEQKLSAVTLDSPLFLTMLHAAVWVPYPIIRIAWFFCYLDQRIRNECWDLELQFRTEAVRLEQLT